MQTKEKVNCVEHDVNIKKVNLEMKAARKFRQPIKANAMFKKYLIILYYYTCVTSLTSIKDASIALVLTFNRFSSSISQ